MDKFFKGVLVMAALLYSFAGTACAEVITVTGTGKYELMAGNNESPALAKERAEKDALRNAAEQAGVYLESKSEVQLGKLTTDEVRTICAALLKVKGVPKFKVAPLTDDSFCYTCELTAQVDTDSITPKMIAELKEDLQRNQHKQELKKQMEQLEQAQKEDTEKYAADIRQYEKHENNKKLQARQWFDTARDFEKNDLLAKAAEAYTNAIEYYPKYGSAYINRGLIYWRLKNYQKAIDDFDMAISINPKSTAAYSNKGTVYYGFIKNYHKAIECYNKVIDLEPKNARVLFWRSSCYYELQEYKNALADMDRVLAIYPQNKEAQERRKEIYAKLSGEK